MNICLVNPRGVSKSGASIPHGLLQLAAELKAHGHEFAIVDFNNPDIPLEYEKLKRYDVVGLSVNTLQLGHAVEIAQSLGTSSRVIWGGIHCLLDPLSILNRFPKHFVVRGEGEIPLLNLANYLDDRNNLDWLREQDGVCFMDGGKPIINKAFFNSNLDKLNDIDYYCLPEFERYLYSDFYYTTNRVSSLGILVSRGCHWSCTFCINSLLAKHGGIYRTKSIEKIRRETEKIIDDFNIQFVNPSDEDFFLNKVLLKPWMQYAKEKGFFWAANCRYNYFVDSIINKNRLSDLMDHGLFAIGMSIEAGDENIRNEILKKKVSDSHIENAIKIIKDTVGDHLAVNTSFIVNFPGDTRDSRIKMLKIMNRLSREINITFSGPQAYRPYPGSELYDKGIKYKEGDLDFYIKGTAASGSLNAVLDNETYFYTHVARVFFNSRFRFYRYSMAKDGRGYLAIDTSGKKTGIVRWLLAAVIKVLFMPVTIRLHRDYWRMFIEPLAVGWIAKTMEKIICSKR